MLVENSVSMNLITENWVCLFQNSFFFFLKWNEYKILLFKEQAILLDRLIWERENIHINILTT